MHDPNEIERRRIGQGAAHPFLGVRVDAGGEDDAAYETAISLAVHPWLADHRLGDLVIVPAAAIAELVRAAAENHLGFAPEIRGLVFRLPIVLQDRRPVYVRVVIAKNRTRVHAHYRSADASGASWVRCAVAHISHEMSERPGRVDIEALGTRCNRHVDVAALYQDLAAAGFCYGPAFRGLRRLACGIGEALGNIQLPVDQCAGGYGMHPALLDAALHVMAGAAPAGGCEAWIPFEVGRLAVYDTERREALVYARRVDGFSRNPIVDITIMNSDGTAIAVMSSVTLRRADALMTPDPPRLHAAAADHPSVKMNDRSAQVSPYPGV
jgi:acyl transferase domain-containing protein